MTHPPTARCALPETPLAHARAGLDSCVHCGFCLQACPTYLALEDENDSPRGRIVLMRSLLEGSIERDDPSAREHLDRCLGCRACETACPSGVPYGQLLEATRATLSRHVPVPFIARAMLWVFARPWALAPVFRAARLLRASGVAALVARAGGRIGLAMAMLSATRPLFPSRAYGDRGAAARGSVALLTGCVMEGLYAATNRATERTLAFNGYAVRSAPAQRCCGALHAHAGDVETARRCARANITAFERSGADLVAVNAAGCGAMMKEYAHLFPDDDPWRARAAAVSARVRDVSELLAAAGPRPGGTLALAVAYDPPCHLLHAQRIAREPHAVLAAIPGLRLRALEEADQCCGAAGIYSLVEPEVSRLVLNRKIAHIAATGATHVATGNPGCLMQIGAGLHQARMPVHAVHPVDLLDASYASLAR